jgi:hypothetical protein
VTDYGLMPPTLNMDVDQKKRMDVEDSYAKFLKNLQNSKFKRKCQKFYTKCITTT